MKLGDRFGQAWSALRGRPQQNVLERELTQLHASFAAAMMTRLNADWVTRCLPSDEELRGDLRPLRGRARDLSRNNGLAIAYLDLCETNIVGANGVGMQCRMKDADGQPLTAFNRMIEDGWKDFSDAPTVDGRQHLVEMSQLGIRNGARDGELIARKYVGYPNRHGLAVQLLDPDLLDETHNVAAVPGQQEVRMSVQIDEWSRPTGYWIHEHPYFTAIGKPPYMIPARDVIHCGRMDRVNQTRFATWFHGVMVAMKMLDGYIEAELVAARIHSAMCWIYERQPELNSGAWKPPANQAVMMEANPGRAGFAPDGYRANVFAPQHPGNQFPDFVKALQRYIASGLGVSFGALSNNLEGFSYSSGRIGLLQERDNWRRHQWWFIRSFLKPLFVEWLNVASMRGLIDLGRITPEQVVAAIEWQPRGYDWVDPKNDIEAKELAIKLGIDSRTRINQELGRDYYEQVLPDLEREQQEAKRRGVSIDGNVPASAAKPAGPGGENENPEDAPAMNGNRLVGMAR